MPPKPWVLTNESRDRFQALFQSYQDELQPQTQIEMDLVEQMTVSKWRQRRLWTIESATLDLALARQEPAISQEFESIDEPTRLAIAFQSTAETGAISLFHRYETSMRRSWDRALDRLESMRSSAPEPPDAPTELPNLPNEPSPEIAHPETTPPENTTQPMEPAPWRDPPGLRPLLLS